MGDDQIFRVILLAGFVLIVPFGIWHRIKTHTGEKLDRRQEGLFILITLRLSGMAAMLAIITYFINPQLMAWASMTVPLFIRWIGIALGPFAGLLLVWTFRTLGRNLTDTVVTRKEHTLVTNGPYRWVRHPFYVSGFLALLAFSFASANWFVFASGGLAILLLAIRSRKEEQNLIARFGDDYRAYMKRTGRFVPRL
jgi:protein-S-isoprenylcysteine O-methyltransferase Ste14